MVQGYTKNHSKSLIWINLHNPQIGTQEQKIHAILKTSHIWQKLDTNWTKIVEIQISSNHSHSITRILFLI